MKLSHIALSLLTLAPAPAIAQQTTPSIVVSYGDLDLGSQAGTKVLDQRLASAIRTVCGEQEGSAIRERRFAAQRCVKEKSAEVALLRDRACTRKVHKPARVSPSSLAQQLLRNRSKLTLERALPPTPALRPRGASRRDAVRRPAKSC